VVTILITTEIGKVYFITACAGSDMPRWLPLIAESKITPEPKAAHASASVAARAGCALDGYGQTHIIIDRELS
jgi:hypothetical protein